MTAAALKEAQINDFAIRCFRDTADKDYISARLSFKAGLYPPFQWSSIHCLEKYTKCILLLNRIDGKLIKHSVSPGIKAVNASGKFKIQLSPDTTEFINELERFARFRYLEISRGCQGIDIMRLDKAVFELRRYCKFIDFKVIHKGVEVDLLSTNVKFIERHHSATKNGFKLLRGYLEKVIETKTHPARTGLVWRNLWFSNSARQSVPLREFAEFEHSPLYLHPNIMDDVLKFVFLPKEIINHYKAMATQPKP